MWCRLTHRDVPPVCWLQALWWSLVLHLTACSYPNITSQFFDRRKSSMRWGTKKHLYSKIEMLHDVICNHKKNVLALAGTNIFLSGCTNLSLIKKRTKSIKDLQNARAQRFNFRKMIQNVWKLWNIRHILNLRSKITAQVKCYFMFRGINATLFQTVQINSFQKEQFISIPGRHMYIQYTPPLTMCKYTEALSGCIFNLSKWPCLASNRVLYR